MNVFVDYDNIQHYQRRRGINNVVMTILEVLPETILPHGADVSIRLYGGWYQYRRLSRVAQYLTGEIAGFSPASISLRTSGQQRTLRVSVELARSMLVDPSRIVSNTFRLRGTPSNLRSKKMPYDGCVDALGCPLQGTYQLLTSGGCPVAECTTELTDVIERHEQKLVDTMLTVDIIHASSWMKSDIVVVTSDDDLWPGIRTAISMGVDVHHIHTQGGRRTPFHYSANVGKNYHQYTI